MKNRLVIERVVFEFYAPLYRIALALASSETEAADLTQETFLILCKRHGQVREPDKIKSWLFTTLRRTFLQTLRRRHSRPQVELKPKHQAQSTVDSTGPRSVDAGAILNALSQLEEGYRTVLELFYIADLSYKEISTTLEIPIRTVMSRLSRGKEQLQSQPPAHFHRNPWAAAGWLFVRVARSSRIALDMLVVTASPDRTALKNSQLTCGETQGN